ncbi:MAG: hypothetical protein WCC60_06250 [Ilumatobacteraceae bacterium]
MTTVSNSFDQVDAAAGKALVWFVLLVLGIVLKEIIQSMYRPSPPVLPPNVQPRPPGRARLVLAGVLDTMGIDSDVLTDPGRASGPWTTILTLANLIAFGTVQVLRTGGIWARGCIVFAVALFGRAVWPEGTTIAPLMEAVGIFCLAHAHAERGRMRTPSYKMLVATLLVSGLAIDCITSLAITYTRTPYAVSAGIAAISYLLLAMAAITHTMVDDPTGHGWRRLSLPGFALGGAGHIASAIVSMRLGAGTLTLLGDSTLAVAMIVMAFVSQLGPEARP